MEAGNTEKASLLFYLAHSRPR